jgi:curved DNA-binding protein CbpA
MIRKIEEMDFYDLLNLPLDASPKDIENAYLLAVAAYHREGLASYGGLGDVDRRLMLDKVEEAFQTLRDPEKKKAYDPLVLPGHPEFQQRAYFRRSTRRLEIEDASEEEKLWGKIKAVLSLPRRRGDGHGHREHGDEWERERLPQDFYYYGDYLKKVREIRGLSREDIAERCGISPVRLESLEEESFPSPSHGEELLEGLKRYAKCLGLDPENGRGSPFSDRFDE